MSASGFVWIKMPTEQQILFWYSKISAIRYGEDDPKSIAYTFNNYIPAIFDTGTSTILVPRSIAPDFFGRILEG